MAFLKLLHADTRQDCLKWCKDLRTVMYKCEEHEDKYIKKFVSNLGWTGNTFSRSVLVGLEEADDKTVPKDILLELQDFARGFSTSVICENGLKHLNARSKDSPSNSISSPIAYHSLLTSELCEDWDRKLPDITAQAKHIKAPHFTAGAFDF